MYFVGVLIFLEHLSRVPQNIYHVPKKLGITSEFLHINISQALAQRLIFRVAYKYLLKSLTLILIINI